MGRPCRVRESSLKEIHLLDLQVSFLLWSGIWLTPAITCVWKFNCSGVIAKPASNEIQRG
jgi:hypothetical protein